MAIAGNWIDEWFVYSWYTIQFFIANFEVILRLGDMRPVESGAHFKVTILKSQIQQPTQTTQGNNWKPWKIDILNDSSKIL